METKEIDKGEEILIAEDSPTQAEMLKFLLEKHEYRISVASNGREALEMITRSKPAIVISDIVMPEMDGYELCRYIKEDENLKDIPVILLTTLSDSNYVLKGLECGADNFIPKPYDEKYLLSRVQNILANRLIRKREQKEMGIKMFFRGQEYYITAARQKILDLLISTYETALWKNIELQKVQDELRVLNEQLEKKVEDRTASLMAEIEVRTRSETALRESEKRYRLLVEFSPYGIIIDSSGKLVYVNLAGVKILGRENPDELIGKTLFQIIHPDYHEIERNRIRMQEEGKVAPPLEEKFLRPDGTSVDVEFASISFTYMGKLAMYGVFRDISERKKAEEIRLENLRLEALDKAKGEFLANMSHELRTPLNASIGFSELLKQGIAGELSEKQKHYVDNILASNQFLLTLINDILDISKMEAGKIELVPDKMSVPVTIQETFSLIKEKAMKHNVLLKTEIDPELEFIEADKQRVKQILFNLLSNAVKFSKEKGGIVTITAKREGDMAQISVSDTGIGIKEENIGKLFQKFEQLEPGISQKYGGTGLGLSISKQLVELHGGRIWAQSKFGENSTFFFTLPLKSYGTEGKQ